ncbi:MAG: ParB/RepB/Spo0J family partition protein [Oscillospiraceae bacterium]|nr:ParB/RepB/Spo0J family partition protein [Oscillospiraceae bacterium]
MTERGLGRGLSALLGDDVLRTTEESVLQLPLSQVEAGVCQPRRNFDDEALAELAESIRIHGILQPLLVRRLASGYYQIIAGERRWRAARIAGLDKVPAIVVEADDQRGMELALIENLQRQDLNPMEEAQGYQVLAETYGMTQEAIAGQVGKSRPAVANALRLLQLPQEVRLLVEEGSLSGGHARALLGLQDARLLTETARRAAAEGLSVRQTERLVKKLREETARTEPVKHTDEVDYMAVLEADLTAGLGRKVRIVSGKKKGRFELEYYGEEDFERLLDALRSLGSGEGSVRR